MVHHDLCFRGHVLTVCCLCCCYVLAFAVIASLFFVFDFVLLWSILTDLYQMTWSMHIQYMIYDNDFIT